MQESTGRARLVAAMIILMVVLAATLSTSAQVGETGVNIRLQRAVFDPLASEPGLPDGLRTEVWARDVSRYFLVQFMGPILEEWKQVVQGLGGEFFDYIPDFAFIVKMDEPTKAHIKELPFVQWVGFYHPAYKLHQDVEGLAAGMVPVVIQTFPHEDLVALLEMVEGLGGAVSSSHADGFGGYIGATLPASSLRAVAQLHAVSWIEPYIAPRLHNDVARSSAILDVDGVWQDLGLYGDGQVVAIADTGLDTGDSGTLGGDFQGRLLATYADIDWSGGVQRRAAPDCEERHRPALIRLSDYSRALQGDPGR